MTAQEPTAPSCGSTCAVLVLMAALLSNFVYAAWDNLGTVFADLSHPAEYRLSTPVMLCLFALQCAVPAGIAALAQRVARRLRAASRPLVLALGHSAAFGLGAFGLAGWLAESDGGLTWLWHEPFTEMFFHPFVTPAAFFISLWGVLRGH